MQSIAERIKTYRVLRGLSRDELAKRSQVNYHTLVKIESGVHPNPTIMTVLRLAKALNVSIDMLVE